jgi:thymidylate synthase (FAD)
MSKVKLIAITKPAAPELLDFTAEELTSYVARVSNPLGYCIKNHHWSVFEHIHITVEIKTSRAIAAQILRHRSAVFQEFSQRYATAMENEFYPARRQDSKNRQNSIDDMSEVDLEWFDGTQHENWERAKAFYDEALRRGIAKEQARMLLPLSTQTTIYMTNNVRNWIHYVDLRSSPSTQLEHREIAIEIKDILKAQLPAISEAKGWLHGG